MKKIGSRSYQLFFVNASTGTTQLLQRDAGMVILKKEWHAPLHDPANVKPAPARHQVGVKLLVGKMVILKDYPDPDAKDRWYVAEIYQVLNDQFTVNGFITTGTPLEGYTQATRKERVRALKGISFLRTWCKDKGKGIATTTPPLHLKGKEKYLWK
jgi:hypothetical protein